MIALPLSRSLHLFNDGKTENLKFYTFVFVITSYHFVHRTAVSRNYG